MLHIHDAFIDQYGDIEVHIDLVCPSTRCNTVFQVKRTGKPHERLAFNSEMVSCPVCGFPLYPSIDTRTAKEFYVLYMESDRGQDAKERWLRCYGIDPEVMDCYREELRKNQGIKKGKSSEKKARKKKPKRGRGMQEIWGV